MRRDASSSLFDVIVACDTVRTFTAGRTRQDFDADEMLRSACERKLEIIGEAMVRLRKDDSSVFDRLTAAHEIIGFRNRLIHGYDSVDSDIVWDIIQRKLEPLADVARAILGTT